ncbi:MAG: TlpA family protein disulfide reductase [Bacteroides sp.]
MGKITTGVVTVALLGLSVVGSASEKKEVNSSVLPENVNVIEESVDVKPDSTGYIVRVGDLAPDFEVTLTDGRSVRLSSLRGKVVMLQFTASWCGVCRREMPFIEKDIWQKHKDKSDFYLIGIDRDEPLDKVVAFGQATKVTYPLGLDPGADIFGRYALKQSGITRNVLIDREGRIVKLTRLYNEEEFASLVELIDRMLEK